MMNTIYQVVVKQTTNDIYKIMGVFARETDAIGWAVSIRNKFIEVLVLPLELEGQVCDLKNKIFAVLFYEKMTAELVIYGCYATKKEALLRSKRACNEGYASVVVDEYQIKGDKKCIEVGSPYDTTLKGLSYSSISQPMSCSLAKQKINHLSLK